MKYGILGSGRVGRTLGTRLVELGHEVRLGARTATAEHAVEWVAGMGDRASAGAFADAAAFGEVLILCTAGDGALSAMAAAGGHVGNKVVIDITNPIAFADGQPKLFTTAESLAELIQAAHPSARVVKTLNTVNAGVMVHPAALADADHVVFLSSDDRDAKGEATSMLQAFGWKQILDLGDLKTARGTEAYLLLWFRLMRHVGSTTFNLRIVR